VTTPASRLPRAVAYRFPSGTLPHQAEGDQDFVVHLVAAVPALSRL
jgi:hypothetical protein